jgi:ankyrin repeat protein
LRLQIGILQEAVRRGDVEIVQLLLDHGADVNMHTKGNEAGASGGTALWWAKKYHESDHPVLELLEKYGAKNVGPHAKLT